MENLGYGCYKDYDVYEKKCNEVCYKTKDYGEYTPEDFLNEVKGNQELADETFRNVDWESPSAYINNLVCDGIIKEVNGTYVYLEE